MLSYDSPASVNGQPSASAKHNISQTAQSSIRSTPPASASLDSTAATMSSTTSSATGHGHHHIWLVTGPAGCGKTTVAEHLANELKLPYIEGDAFHTQINVEKMRTGTPLTDADRWDWLTQLREESMRQINGGSKGVILTCSALKRKYRDVIRVAAYYDHRVLIHFIYLDASEEMLLERVQKRQDHYMGPNMVHSQFEALEQPSADERDVINVDVSRTIEEVKQDALVKVTGIITADR